MERQRSYTYWDIRVQMDEWRSELQYIHAVWNNSAISGRPLVVLIIGEHMMKGGCACLCKFLIRRRNRRSHPSHTVEL
jgi:hypothetical protein